MTDSETSQRESGSDVKDWTTFILPDGSAIPRTWSNVKEGLIPWDEVDDEELSKGKLRDKNGQFRGGGHERVIPRQLLPEMTRRLKDRYDAKIRERVLDMVDKQLDVALSDNAADPDKLRAITYLTERIFGKVPDKVEVVAEVKPWEGLVEGVLQDLPPSD